MSGFTPEEVAAIQAPQQEDFTSQELTAIRGERSDAPINTKNGRWAVLDGDTVIDNETGERLRLRGLNTREIAHGEKPAELGGYDQRQALLDELEAAGDDVFINRHGEDNYGRTIGDLVTLRGNINDTLVMQGAERMMDSDNARRAAALYRARTQNPYPTPDQQSIDAAGTMQVNPDAYYRTGDFKKAIVRGTDQSQMMLYAAADAVGQTLGIDAMREWARSGIEDNARDIGENPARVGTLDNIDDFGDFGTYFVEAIGEQIPQLGIDVLGAVGGAGIGGVGAALARRQALRSFVTDFAKAGGISAIYGQSVGETQLELQAEGIDDPKLALTAGAFKAGLEYAGLSSMFKGLSRSAGIAEGTLVNMARQIGERAGVSAAVEASTEAAQTVIDFMAVGLHTPGYDLFSDANIKELKEAMAKGGIVGGAFRGVGEGAKVALNKAFTGTESYRDAANQSAEEAAEQVVPETDADLRAQVVEMREGRKNAIIVPPATTLEQHQLLQGELGEGVSVATRSDGTHIYSYDADLATQYSESAVESWDQAVRQDAEILGYTQSKADIQNPETAQTVAVKNPDGSVAHSEAVDRERVQEVLSKLQNRKTPEQEVVVTDTSEEIARRLDKEPQDELLRERDVSGDEAASGGRGVESAGVGGGYTGPSRDSSNNAGLQGEGVNAAGPQNAPSQTAGERPEDSGELARDEIRGNNRDPRNADDVGGVPSRDGLGGPTESSGSGAGLGGELEAGTAGEPGVQEGLSGETQESQETQVDNDYVQSEAIADHLTNAAEIRALVDEAAKGQDKNAARWAQRIKLRTVQIAEEMGISEDEAQAYAVEEMSAEVQKESQGTSEGALAREMDEALGAEDTDLTLADVPAKDKAFKYRRAARQHAAKQTLRYPSFQFTAYAAAKGKWLVGVMPRNFKSLREAQGYVSKVSAVYPQAYFEARRRGDGAFYVVEKVRDKGEESLDMQPKEIRARLKAAQFAAAAIRNTVKKNKKQGYQVNRIIQVQDPNGKTVELSAPVLTSLGMNVNGDEASTQTEFQAAARGFHTGVGLMLEQGYTLSDPSAIYDNAGRIRGGLEFYVRQANARGFVGKDTHNRRPGAEQKLNSAKDSTLEAVRDMYEAIGMLDEFTELVKEGAFTDVPARNLSKDQQTFVSDSDRTYGLDPDLKESDFIEDQDPFDEDAQRNHDNKVRRFDEVTEQGTDTGFNTVDKAPYRRQASDRLNRTAQYSSKSRPKADKQGNVEVYGVKGGVRHAAYIDRAQRALGLDHKIEIYDDAAVRKTDRAQYALRKGEHARTITTADGTQVIVFSTRAAKNLAGELLLVGHELGHYAYRTWLNSEPATQVRNRLGNAFKRVREDYAQYDDATAFEEWFSDQTSAWLKDQTQAADSVFGKLKHKLREIFDRLVSALPAEMVRRFKTRRAFTNFMDQIVKEGGFGPMQAEAFEASYRPLTQSIRQHINRRIPERARQIGKDWAQTGIKALRPIMTADRQLRKLSPQLADLFWQNTSTNSSRGIAGLFNILPTKRGGWLEQVTALEDQYSEEVIREGYIQLQQKADRDQLNPFARDMANFLENEVWPYLKEHIPTLGKIEGYFPRMWDVQQIQERPQEFDAMMADLGYPDPAAIRHSLIDGLGSNELSIEEFNQAVGPGFKSSKARALTRDGTDAAAQANNFVVSDPRAAVSNYLMSAVRRAEYEKRAGGYHRVQGWGTGTGSVDERSEVTDELREMRDMYNRRKLAGYLQRSGHLSEEWTDRTHGAEVAFQAAADEAVREGYLQWDGDYDSMPLWYNPHAKVSDLMGHIPAEDRPRAEKIINAYMGRLGQDLDPNVRRVMSGLLVYESYLTLLFSALASLPDLAGPIVNSKDFKGVKQAFRTYVETAKNREEAYKRAHALGTIQRKMTNQALLDLFGQAHTSGFAQNAMEKLFHYNGQEMLTNASRVLATAVGEEFILEHAHGAAQGHQESVRYLRELNIDANTVLRWEREGKQAWTSSMEGQMAKDAEAVQQSIGQFVDNSVVRPNAAQRPIWASDPKFMLIWHLKSFFYSYGKVFIGGIGREMVNRFREADGANARKIAYSSFPMLAAAALLLPLAAAGLEARELVQYWGDDPTERLDSVDYALELTSRAGIYGPLELGAAFFGVGSHDAGPITLAGPTLQHLHTLINSPADIKIKRSLPVFNQNPALWQETKELFY